MAIVLQFAGHLADWLHSKGILTITQVCDFSETSLNIESYLLSKNDPVVKSK